MSKALAVREAYDAVVHERAEIAELERLKINALERPYIPDIEIVPEFWEPEHVGKRIVEAYRTVDRLPAVNGPREPGGSWPDYTYEKADRNGWEEGGALARKQYEADRNRVRIVPSAIDLDRMEIILFDRANPQRICWISQVRTLDDGMARILHFWGAWSARNRNLGREAQAKGWPKSTFYRKQRQGVVYLASWLNGQRVEVF